MGYNKSTYTKTLFKKDGWTLSLYISDNESRLVHDKCGLYMYSSIKYGKCIGCTKKIPSEMVALWTLYDIGSQ